MTYGQWGTGDQIRIRREARRLSLNDMANATGYPVGVLNSVELNTIQPEPELLKKIAAVFKVDPTDLLLWPSAPATFDHTINILLQESIGMGDLIRFYRTFQRLTLHELALRTKLSIGYLAQLELQSRTSPTLDVLERIAAALQVALVDLLQVTDRFYQAAREHEELPSGIQERFVAYLQSLSAEVRSQVELMTPSERVAWTMNFLVDVCKVKTCKLARVALTSPRSLGNVLTGGYEARVIWGVLVSIAAEISIFFIMKGWLP